jgi:hypothetical protein
MFLDSTPLETWTKAMTKRLNPIWMPTRSVGPFALGLAIEPHVAKLGLRVHADEMNLDGERCISYVMDDRNLMIGTRDGRIDAVHAFRRLLYGGKELIGLTERDLRRHVGAPDWVAVKSKKGQIERLDSNALGAMFFFEEGRVDSAILSPKD